MNIEITPHEIYIRINPHLTYDTIPTPIDRISIFNWFWCDLIMFPRVMFSAARFLWSFKFQVMPQSIFLFISVFFAQDTEMKRRKTMKYNIFFIRWRRQEEEDEQKHRKTSRNTKKSTLESTIVDGLKWQFAFLLFFQN